MRTNRKSRFQLRLASTSFVVLLLTVVGLLLWLSRDHHVQFDWTRTHRNTLSEASRTLLMTLDKPVQLTAYARDTEGVRQNIAELVARYQKYKKDIVLEYVNRIPTRQACAPPACVSMANWWSNTNGRKENLSQLTEEAFTNVLVRLGRGGERWVIFVSGHGERSPDRQANFDLSTWAAQLAKRGLKTRSLALGGQNAIPQNTSVAGNREPTREITCRRSQQIEQYLARAATCCGSRNRARCRAWNVSPNRSVWSCSAAWWSTRPRSRSPARPPTLLSSRATARIRWCRALSS